MIERELAYWPQWNVLMRPHLGDVENVPSEVLCILWIEHLDVHGPRWVLSSGNSVKEILSVPVGISRCQMIGLLQTQSFEALVLPLCQSGLFLLSATHSQ